MLYVAVLLCEWSAEEFRQLLGCVGPHIISIYNSRLVLRRSGACANVNGNHMQ